MNSLQRRHVFCVFAAMTFVLSSMSSAADLFRNSNFRPDNTYRVASTEIARPLFNGCAAASKNLSDCWKNSKAGSFQNFNGVPRKLAHATQNMASTTVSSQLTPISKTPETNLNTPNSYRRNTNATYAAESVITFEELRRLFPIYGSIADSLDSASEFRTGRQAFFNHLTLL